MSAVLAAVIPVVTSIALAPMVSADEGAYARLLAAHGRSGVVNGIRLALVDYAAAVGEPTRVSYRVALFMSASVCSSQNRMSISWNIRAAPASSSRARW